MKNLQVKEKLVAINERYGEAQTIRNELKSLEIQEQNRVENLILQEHEKRRKKLEEKFSEVRDEKNPGVLSDIVI